MVRVSVFLAALLVAATPIALAQTDQSIERVNVTQKGSLIVWPYIPVSWNLATGQVQIDTLISLTNDYSSSGVRVKFYLVNGDAQIPAWIPPGGGPPVEPGCNYQDAVVDITHDEPVYWSAFTGAKTGTSQGVWHGGSVMSAITALDPNGRDDPDFADVNIRRLRCYLIAFAVDTVTGRPIRFNHLVGSATVIDYTRNTAFEYQAWAYRAVFSTSQPMDRLNMNGVDYSKNPEYLLMEFFAAGSDAYRKNLAGNQSSAEGRLVLLPMQLDFTSSRPLEALTTDAKVDVWDENEVKHTNLHRCIHQWDATTFTEYASMNNFFTVGLLTTDRGKARINPQTNIACERVANPNASPPDPGHLSSNVPLIGLTVQSVSWVGDGTAMTAKPLASMGERLDGYIKFVPQTNPPEKSELGTEYHKGTQVEFEGGAINR